VNDDDDDDDDSKKSGSGLRQTDTTRAVVGMKKQAQTCLVHQN
jgi:hypothetical protein